MGCKKKTFESMMLAEQRAFEINEENANSKKQDKKLRAYLCWDCKSYHLTSLTKKSFDKYILNMNAKTKKREENFINREVEFWEKYFKIK